jgi:hypothetical protein
MVLLFLATLAGVIQCLVQMRGQEGQPAVRFSELEQGSHLDGSGAIVTVLNLGMLTNQDIRYVKQRSGAMILTTSEHRV